jgi:uncharacterized protein (DUF433 family)
MVAVVLDNLAEGMTPEEIIAQYPPLTLEDIRAAIGYAATLPGRRNSFRCDELCREGQRESFARAR